MPGAYALNTDIGVRHAERKDHTLAEHMTVQARLEAGKVARLTHTYRLVEAVQTRAIATTAPR
jgi:hypothetical protein